MEKIIRCSSLKITDVNGNIYSFERWGWFDSLTLLINEEKREARIIQKSWWASRSVLFVSDFMSYQYEEAT